jgi:four helix bundle protein
MSTPKQNNNSAKTEQTFRTFEDLEVYKVSREFRKAMYRVAKRLPDIEKFGLAGQIRRAAVSLTNNIAEGHGRFHYLDQIKFNLIARGSLQELIDDLNVCSDEGYLAPAEIESLKSMAAQVMKLMNGYLRYLRDRKLGASLELRESPASYGSSDRDEMTDLLEDLLAESPDSPI